MNGLLMMGIALIVLGGGYFIYGNYLCKTWGIDENAKTPAYELEDGVDYVPADTQVVFGHQFASIAGAGPINGPIQASVFGWIPVLLWILFGGIFFGAVQDFVAMYASVKNKGRTIGYIIEEYIGKAGKKLFLAFTWLFCILVVAAFADVVANTFVSSTANEATNIANGAVATTSCLFILEAVALGFFLKHSNCNKWVNTAIAIVLLFVGVGVGLSFPLLGVSASTWHLTVFIYILIASVVPVWALLQPRDYLNSYLLILMMGAAVIGVLVANPDINLPAFTGFHNESMGNMFPILFVTIACGAVSGFHALVSSGTSSKQIKNEKHMLPVSFGAMLLECLLAVIALIAVGSFTTGAAAELGYTTPSLIFAGAVANFLEVLGLPHSVVFTIINLAVSAFALTSLDSVARVGRIAFQEFFLDSSVDVDNMPAHIKFLTNKYVATAATLILAYALAKVGYATIWPLFGSANQLLSALALIACAVFLKKTNRKGFMLWIPMVIMLIITLTALIQIIISKVGVLSAVYSNTFIYPAAIIEAGTQSSYLNLQILSAWLQLAFGGALFILGVTVAIQGFAKLLSNDTVLEDVAFANGVPSSSSNEDEVENEVDSDDDLDETVDILDDVDETVDV